MLNPGDVVGLTDSDKRFFAYLTAWAVDTLSAHLQAIRRPEAKDAGAPLTINEILELGEWLFRARPTE